MTGDPSINRSHKITFKEQPENRGKLSKESLYNNLVKFFLKNNDWRKITEFNFHNPTDALPFPEKIQTTRSPRSYLSL